ncbi:hypothetical protein HHX48_07015 [Salinimonas sp. HHU 13199]|uniref:Lipoprotein n=1 Tax=Salinimonas profundi TaxID=2729140 RepID=A0ABR8LM65_9ALTE|nr:hypothetical protein [Salinimonas profundi]MBD3585477.1 hypothetical protein [Salinimonas profundi]
MISTKKLLACLCVSMLTACSSNVTKEHASSTDAPLSATAQQVQNNAKLALAHCGKGRVSAVSTKGYECK